MTKTEQILNECKNIYAMNYGFASYEDFQHKLSIGNSNAHDFQDAIELLASHLFAQRMSEKFADYLDKLPDLNRFTVHPRAGSGAGTGIYKKENSQLYTEFITELNKEKSEFDTDKNQDIVELSRDKD